MAATSAQQELIDHPPFLQMPINRHLLNLQPCHLKGFAPRLQLPLQSPSGLALGFALAEKAAKHPGRSADKASNRAGSCQRDIGAVLPGHALKPGEPLPIRGVPVGPWSGAMSASKRWLCS